MVIAAFLTRHLLEPQERRLLEQGRQQGREEIFAELFGWLEEQGFDLENDPPAGYRDWLARRSVDRHLGQTLPL